MNGLAEALVKHAEESKPPRDETMQKFALLRDVEYAEPRTVGKRTYDDKEFVASLQSQAEGGKRLSENQLKYLDRLVLKYADQIPDFDKHKEALGLDKPPETEADPATGEILGMLEKITEWNEPVQRGKRVWDDKEFFTSLSTQFKQKGALSPRQVAAMRKMAGRYADKIEGFDANAERLQLQRPKRKAKKEE